MGVNEGDLVDVILEKYYYVDCKYKATRLNGI